MFHVACTQGQLAVFRLSMNGRVGRTLDKGRVFHVQKEKGTCAINGINHEQIEKAILEVLDLVLPNEEVTPMSSRCPKFASFSVISDPSSCSTTVDIGSTHTFSIHPSAQRHPVSG